MKQYREIVENILSNGTMKESRTGKSTLSLTGQMFEHDMSDGFPLLTTKKMGLKNIATELEFFIKGHFDKGWLQERNCHIWDEWCNPQKVPYAHDKVTKAKMEEEKDLGRVYGVQWRDWRGKADYGYYTDSWGVTSPIPVIKYERIDQLRNVINKLKSDPFDRRMIVMAWNPTDLNEMALPPCHYSFQILSDGKHVDLLWNQRSVDVPLGLPYNIASYALLLMLISKEVNMIPRKLIGFLADVHIYEDQLEGIKEQIKRDERSLPTLELPNNINLFTWDSQTQLGELKGYDPHPAIKFPIAV